MQHRGYAVWGHSR